MELTVKATGQLPLIWLEVKCGPNELFLAGNIDAMMLSTVKQPLAYGVFLLEVIENFDNKETVTYYLFIHRETYSHAFLITRDMADFTLEEALNQD